MGRGYTQVGSVSKYTENQWEKMYQRTFNYFDLNHEEMQ